MQEATSDFRDQHACTTPQDQHYIQGSKYLWRMPEEHPRSAAAIASRYNLALPIAQTLLSRGFTTPETIDPFLFTAREHVVADIALMKDVLPAIERIEQAIKHEEKILICGDYDVDGITSSALMMIALLPLGAKVNFFLPHRIRDGYGLSTQTILNAARNDFRVIITVDNGITAFEQAEKARELGIDLIITDHHRQHETLPQAYAIVNPNQNACNYPFKAFAGVGVSFKLLSLLYERQGKALPPKAFELLLLGTVADVVPLIGENRFWVRHCLQIVNGHESVSLRTLKSNGKLLAKEKISSLDVGFSIAPQINALGRLEDPRQAVQFLIGSNEAEVEKTGRILLSLNEARKEIERATVAEIMGRIAAKEIDLENEYIIMASASHWSPGVIGLVASRLVGTFGKPAILFHETPEGILKGSCRSITPFNMFDALQASAHLLEKFGGHSQAAGLSVKREHKDLLKQELEKRARQQLTPFDLQQKISLDAELPLSDANKKLMHDLGYVAPFGHANPAPLFFIRAVTQIQKPTLLKDAHVKCTIFADGIVKSLIFFNRPELYPLLLAQEQEPFSVAAQVQENFWNGQVTVELHGTDIANIKKS